ncbi:hypothetical protein GIB67_013864, partial [Kingdonia uniflora]
IPIPSPSPSRPGLPGRLREVQVCIEYKILSHTHTTIHSLYVTCYTHVTWVLPYMFSSSIIYKQCGTKL